MIDLGSAPPSNAYLTATTLRMPEKWLPLKVMVCEKCWLVQTDETSSVDDLFDADYAYFSSFSKSWLDHARNYVAEMSSRFSLGDKSFVVEIAANDGYLLQYFKQDDIACLGVEPTSSTATAARAKGIEIVEDFFGVKLAKDLVEQYRPADLVAANNVLAHVPDINDFVSGFSVLLAEQGVATFEFPHLQSLVAESQFDTIYHEHFSYLSLSAVQQIFRRNGLGVFDVEKLSTHGGSLRVYAQRLDTGEYTETSVVRDLLKAEEQAGITSSHYYAGLQGLAEQIKNEFLEFLVQAKKTNKKVVGYGAAAKGNTLLNFAGVRPDLLPWVVDLNPSKQGKYLPGSRIPIVSESEIRKYCPDFVVILPWNLRDELIGQLDYIREWGGRFVTAIPNLEISH